jgi:hypothetical protein
MNRAESYYENAVRLIGGGTLQRVVCAECGQRCLAVVFGDNAGRCLSKCPLVGSSTSGTMRHSPLE